MKRFLLNIFGKSLGFTKHHHALYQRRKSRLTLERLEDRTVPSTLLDFNGDGFDDLAIGVPSAHSDQGSVGAVHVVYGAAAGLTADNTQVWTQNSFGIPDSEEINDQFGSAVAGGDFNSDGFGDLAIGVPLEDLNPGGGILNDLFDVGAVQVLYGSSTGLTSAGNQFLTQRNRPFFDPVEDEDKELDDRFGSSLAVGDFDGDGFDDLAVGVPSEDIGPITGAGAVQVWYGSATGLTVSGRIGTFWAQNSGGIEDTPEQSDAFGKVLTTGDFNGDGKHDLAIGVSLESVGNISGAGAVHVLYGSMDPLGDGSMGGLTASDSQFWTQNSPGVADSSEANDGFGFAVAAGDFNGDGHDELVISSPFEGLKNVVFCGAVHVLIGSSARLTGQDSQFWNQDTYGIADKSEKDDSFGYALTAGDFNGDGNADLAIGSRESFPGKNQAGAVHVLYGSAGGLTAVWNQFWTQDSTGISDSAETDDFFGRALTAGDFNNDGRADLAIGAPSENLLGTEGEVSDSGAIHLLYGTANRLSATDSQFWTQELLGIFGTGGDRFGDVL